MLENIIQGAGIFIYPLGLCSFLGLLVLFERILTLAGERRSVNKLHKDLYAAAGGAAGKIVGFFRKNSADEATLKSYAKLELSKLERGMFILDIVIATAPLLGLLGTVMGLVQVFANMPAEGMAPQGTFVQGIALALSTTMLGLVIAIPAIVGNSYLSRKLDILGVNFELLIEKLLNSSKA